MDKLYYINSTKYSIYERMTKRGKVYDIRFRIFDKNGVEKQKKLSGFANKTLAKQGYVDFVTEYCELIKNNPILREKRQQEGKATLTIRDLSKNFSAL